MTVLYPFVDRDLLDAGALVALREELAGFRRFPLTLTRLLRFPSSPATLYLAPEPAAPFADMTRRVAGRFGLEPYGGGHDQVVPHLTVAMADDQALLDRIERDVAPRLPIATTVDAVHVIAHTGDGWGVAHEIRLAP